MLGDGFGDPSAFFKLSIARVESNRCAGVDRWLELSFVNRREKHSGQNP